MIKKLMLSAATFGTTVALAGGVTFAGSITNTGNNSKNIIKEKNIQICKNINNNSVELDNHTSQRSKTGKAKVSDNTTGGNANSGSASNANDNTVDLTVTNHKPSCHGNDDIQAYVVGGALIDQTGQHSYNLISTTNISKVISVNNNDLSVDNETLQHAKSGNATVWGNTTGGNANSGDATNMNSSSITITISNN